LQVSVQQVVAVFECNMQDGLMVILELLSYSKFQDRLVQVVLFLWEIYLIQPISLVQILDLKRQIMNL
jgi:hypothetical protein